MFGREQRLIYARFTESAQGKVLSRSSFQEVSPVDMGETNVSVAKDNYGRFTRSDEYPSGVEVSRR
jgi:hypothetical protein